MLKKQVKTASYFRFCWEDSIVLRDFDAARLFFWLPRAWSK